MTTPFAPPPATSLLLVDDDLSHLESIEAALRDVRPAWKLRFAQSGDDALSRLEREPADVVVSKLHMQRMDGADLLTQVREKYPRCIRLMASGRDDREGMRKALAVAHQFLARPCDPSQLRSAVSRASMLQSRLHSLAVTQALGMLGTLPALPRLYYDLTREMDSEHATSTSVCAILEQDVAMTARILQVVNSALFAHKRQLTHVHDAVTYLGFEPIRSLVLAAGLFRAMSSICAPPGFSLDAVQQHSMRVARIAMSLLRDVDERKTAFSAAMLHDIGQIVLALGLPKEYAVVSTHCARDNRSRFAVEQDVHGCTHAEVGAHLLAMWGLPNALVEAVAFHHAPSALPETKFGVAGAVHLADWLDHASQHLSKADSPGAIDRDYLAKVGMLDQLPVLVRQVQQRLAA